MPKILVIDDDEQIRWVIMEFLRFQKFDVTTAADGEEGVSLIPELKPDLIVCDLEMPRMNGHQVIMALNHDEKNEETPVILLSGCTDHRQIRRSMNLGAEDFLAKPLRLDELSEAISASLQRRETRRRRQKRRIQQALDEAARAILPPVPKLEESVLIRTSERKEFVKLGEIKRITAEGEHSTLFWGDDAHGRLRKSLCQWEDQLPEEQFVRVHRKDIVNLAFLGAVTKLPAGQLQLRLKGLEQPVVVSLRRAPLLNKRMAAFAASTKEPSQMGQGLS